MGSMRSIALLAASVVASVLLAGCGAAVSEVADGIEPTALVDSETGAIEGVVTDDSLVPLAGAQVGILEQGITASTDAQGRFALSKIAPGQVSLAAQALGYNAAAQRIEVRAGEVSQASIQLSPLPVIDPYHVTQEKKGRIFCGTHVRPATSFAACGAVYNTPLSGLDTFVVPFDLASGNISAVAMMVFETAWTPTQVLGSGLNVRWESFTNVTPAYTFTEPVRTFATKFGKSPLWTSADAETIQSNVTKHKPSMCKPNGPCKLWARVFPYANTLGPSSPVDAAFYIDQGYTHYSTEFYGLPAPLGFTVLSDR